MDAVCKNHFKKEGNKKIEKNERVIIEVGIVVWNNVEVLCSRNYCCYCYYLKCFIGFLDIIYFFSLLMLRYNIFQM